MTTTKPDGSGPPASGSLIAVIDKAAVVLDALLRYPTGATPTELSTDLGLNRSTTFRLLTSLEHSGLLDRNPSTGRYRLGLRLLVLGDAVRERLDLVRLAAPILHRIRDTLRQTVFLSEPDGSGATCLERLPGPDVDILAWRPGQHLPFHTGAAPGALLAALPDPDCEAYLDQTGPWWTRRGELSAADLRAQIRRTRDRGWSINREDVTDGVCSLGVAVRRADLATPACALSVAGLSSGFTGERLDRMAEVVLAGAAELSALLSGRTPG
jgi:DNA-binding IclR family transcriptional regulator